MQIDDYALDYFSFTYIEYLSLFRLAAFFIFPSEAKCSVRQNNVMQKHGK